MIWMIFIKILKNTIQLKNKKTLIVFDDMIADMLNNKKLNPIVIELFIRGRKLNIYLAFITQSYFAVTKNIRLNSTHYFAMKIPNERELQQIIKPLIIHQMLTFKTLWIFIKSGLKNHICFVYRYCSCVR